MSARFSRTLPFTLAGLLAITPAFAQQPPADPATTAGAPAGAVDKHAHARVEHRIADLRTKLKITSDETPAFDAFAGVMRDNANHMDTLLEQRHQTTVAGTAVDDMKSYQSMAQAHVDDLNRLVPAFETLYGALSPEQKKLADQSFHDFQGRGRERKHG